MENSYIKKIIYAGLMMALVFIATAVLPRIPIPFTQQSYIHAGDSMIFIAAILFGWKYGAVVGGLGSALADIFVGATIWALPTLIVKAIMGAIVGFMAHETRNLKYQRTKNIVSIAVAASWLALGIGLYNALQDVTSSPLAASLTEQLGLEGIDKLSALAMNVRNILMGAVIGIPVLIIILFIALNRRDRKLFNINTILGMTLGGLCMVIGYYIAEIFIVGNFISPIFSIPFNLLQFIGGAVIGFVILIPLKKTTMF